MVKGIDVSFWQGDIAWERVAASGIGFAMIRAAYSDQAVDRTFEQNMLGSSQAGLPRGAYLYALAKTPEQARDEARFLIDLVKPYRLEYPLAYDVEEPGIYNSMDSGQISAIVQAFCTELQQHGYYAMLYSSVSRLNTVFDNSTIRQFDIWAAQWAQSNQSKLPSGIWQYSATGRVEGIVGNVDLDYSYKDYPAIIKKAGLNGWEREQQPDYKALYEQQKQRADLAQQELSQIKQAVTELYEKYSKES